MFGEELGRVNSAVGINFHVLFILNQCIGRRDDSRQSKVETFAHGKRLQIDMSACQLLEIQTSIEIPDTHRPYFPGRRLALAVQS
jgi:hypothetical protein